MGEQILNTVTIEGLEFVEFTSPEPESFIAFIEALGFSAIAKHRHKDVLLYRKDKINFIINATKGSFAQAFAEQHGASICAIALRVQDAASAYQELLAKGAWEANTSAGIMELNIPAIECIGGTQIYLVDRFGDDLNIYDIDFKYLSKSQASSVSHAQVTSLSLSVAANRLQQWRDYFCQLLAFTAKSEYQLVSSDGSLTIVLEPSALEADLNSEGFNAINLGVSDSAAFGQSLQSSGLNVIDRSDDSGAYCVSTHAFDSSVSFLISEQS